MWNFDEFFLILTLFVFFVPGKAEIIVSPKDTEAAAGEDATISCVTSAGSCVWYHLPIGASVYDVLYQDGFIHNGYKERFRVMETKPGLCNLQIANVQIADAGLFTCLEASGSQKKETAELIVFAQYPSNQSCSAIINCSPSCKNMELSCNMKSYGNIKPFMEWRDARGNLVNSSTDKEASVVQVTGDLSKHLVYSCYVKYHRESLSSKFNWSYAASVKLEYEPTVTTEESRQKEYTNTGAIIIACSVAVFFLITTCIFAVFGFVLLYRRNAPRRLELRSAGSQDTGSVHYRVSRCRENVDVTPESLCKPTTTGPHTKSPAMPDDDEESGVLCLYGDDHEPPYNPQPYDERSLNDKKTDVIVDIPD